MTMIDCYRCHGTGQALDMHMQISIRNGIHIHQSVPDIPFNYSDCPDCDATGKIEEPQKTDVGWAFVHHDSES